MDKHTKLGTGVVLIALGIAAALVFLAGCGSSEYTPPAKCTDVFTQSFCDSIRGEDGTDGTNGSSCSAEDTLFGSLISCDDGTQAAIYDGEDGTSCVVQEIEGGANVICAGSEVFIADGKDGSDGIGCSAIQEVGGATIICGSEGQTVFVANGQDGKDALVETIDPCGKKSSFDEVLLRFSDGRLYAVYADIVHLKVHLVVVIDGSYVTTDGTGCYFQVVNGQVIW